MEQEDSDEKASPDVSRYASPFERRRESDIMATTHRIRARQLDKFYFTTPVQMLAREASRQWEIPTRTKRQQREQMLPQLEPVPGFKANQHLRKPEIKRMKATEQLSRSPKLPSISHAVVPRDSNLLHRTSTSTSLVDSGLDLSQKDPTSKISPSRRRMDKAGTSVARGQAPSDLPEVTNFLLLDPKIFEDVTDPLAIVQLVRKYPELGFLYMIHPVSRGSVQFTPYKLKIVGFEKINKSDFFTISLHGVTHFWANEASFTELSRWEKEYKHYVVLRKRRTFRKFRLWKSFMIWRKTVRYDRIAECRHELQLHLYILNHNLRKSLLQVSKLCGNLLRSPLLHIIPNVMYELEEFQKTQLETIANVKEQLEDFREEVKHEVHHACQQAMLALGFVPDDCVDQYPDMAANPDKMTYAEQANKRSYCERLTRYIKLIDYLILTTKHEMVRNACAYLLSILKECLERYTRPAESSSDKKGDGPPKLKTLGSEVAMFHIHFYLENDRDLAFNPNQLAFHNTVKTLVMAAQEMTRVVVNITPDNFFDAFTSPLINSKIEKKTCGPGPDIMVIFMGDGAFNKTVKDIQSVINETFCLCRHYTDTLVPVRDFFLENEALDLEAIKQQNHDIQFFSKSLQTYAAEIATVQAIPNTKYLGVVLMDLTGFKTLVLPSPTKCLEVINEILPLSARKTMDSIYNEIQEAQSKMEKRLVTTEDYVEYITFVDFFEDRVNAVELICDKLQKMYDLIEKHKVPTPPEDLAVFSTLSPIIQSVKIMLTRCLDDRNKRIDDFCTSLDLDIIDMNEELLALKAEIDNPVLLDPDADQMKVRKMLKSLQGKLDEYLKQANQYKTFQKNFQVEVTEFVVLDQINNEMKLRQLVWDSIDNWDAIVKKWTTTLFSQLDPDVVAATTTKYVKICNQLTKGLPDNKLVDVLKAKVESMKAQLPLIADLRNPAMKPRHWEMIEDVLGVSFTETPLTLQLLKDSNAAKLKDEITAISGQASAETQLEGMLKRVEEMWKTAELPITPFRDSKDVFVLGPLDEIQALWDESNVTIGTIMSSRNIGPIRARVEEWELRLRIFTKTADEWVNAQRNWLYLESIFSAPDIQRQLPIEAKMFAMVDKTWKDIMRRANRLPMAMPCITQPGMLEALQNSNALLEQIMKCLEAYLESKRLVFPRFYFLSNEELLEILAQARNPLAVQPHLRKCFDAIASLDMEADEDETSQRGTEIMGMVSAEGERVVFFKTLKARGSVEEWLGKVEDTMFTTIRKCIKTALLDYETKARKDWVIVGHASQDLNDLASLVRGKLSSLNRNILCALITIDVHARDIISELVNQGVDTTEDFQWQRQLRYYWDMDTDVCVVRMANSFYMYGYEYLGASPRLVITPLTDRCYLCLIGAMQLNLGGAPAGPAGTGKTETTKDLAKSLANQCVVFNCSDGMDYIMMGKFFSGVAQSGAWACFDEFNRITLEVLSVVAQQLITIRFAKVNRLFKFMFEGREIRLVNTCASFITMNPGYAGRTELPDNLKALFRPISMMVPNYTLIAEVILYSEGFESSKNLARKMTNMYKLCSEQLSQQDHYDFGMRAVKSVLVMAGSLKRENPDKLEDVVLLRALRDSNLPKFLAQDAGLFLAILQDLFPGLGIPEHDYGLMDTAIRDSIANLKLQPHPAMIRKVLQLFETMVVRHGCMLVGPPAAGKTVCYEILRDALVLMYKQGIEHVMYKPVHVEVMNPKSISMGELYGEVNFATMEWKDGLLGFMVRNAINAGNDDRRWIVCDGPVDAVWIENLNSVLDDNKLLCLANSERMKLTPYIHMIFEVQDLAQASPATVSRCGMVYLDPNEMKWIPYVQTWLEKIEPEVNDYVVTFIWDLFSKYIDGGLKYTNKNCVQVIPQVDLCKVAMLCSLMESLLIVSFKIDLTMEYSRLSNVIAVVFAFSYLWSIGGNLNEAGLEMFDVYIRNQMEDDPNAKLPPLELNTLFLDYDKMRLESWDKIVPSFVYNPSIPFFDMLVPTVDTVRYSFMMEKLLAVRHPVLFTGLTGVGKSVIARDLLLRIMDRCGYVPVFISFSAQTASGRTQNQIENKLDKPKKNVLGAPPGKRVIIFIDDINMPKLDTYGSQPPIELLRQYLDFKGFYDRDKLCWKEVHNVTLVAACGPPGGGRNPVTARLTRHFCIYNLPVPNDLRLKAIFKAILSGFFASFALAVREKVEAVVNALVDIFTRMSTDLLPTPAKSHYVFNLRDLSKCVQGIIQCNPLKTRDVGSLFRIFCHESQRVFHDRLINEEDKKYFREMMVDLVQFYFNIEVDSETLQTKPIIFGDFMQAGVDRSERVYEEITNYKKMQTALEDCMDDYSASTGKDMNLVLFMDAMEHVARISRILRQERGNALLVGVGGCGKQSLTKLASHISSCTTFQIELKRGYDYNTFHDDLKKLYEMAGLKNTPLVFLFPDTQIIMEEFLEDINNMLNSGEVPNMFAQDEVDRIIMTSRNPARDAGVNENDRDGIYSFFINRTRANLHIVLCMSPVGDAFRTRCRMFPSLVNCCTIDWFTEWPQEALLGVASNLFQGMDLGANTERLREVMPTACVDVHVSVTKVAELFFIELRRYYYTTPTSYLELINLYKTILDAKKQQLSASCSRIQLGLNKLNETNRTVEDMQVELTALEPVLLQKSEDTDKLMVKLLEDQEKVDLVRQVIQEDEAVAKMKADDTQAIANDAQRDLDLAAPALDQAIRALDALDKSDIAEIRVFINPPDLVQTVMESVCILFKENKDWASAKLLLADPNFVRKLYDYDKDNIPESIIKKLKKYIENPNFVPEVVEKTSKACKSICMWVRAIDLYARIFKTVEPKRKRLLAANEELALVMENLHEKQARLAEVEAQIQYLQDQYGKSIEEKEFLEFSMQQTADRLQRASKLTTGLVNEQVRWAETVKKFNDAISHIVGDVFVATACLSYYGAFTSSYRQRLVKLWANRCLELEIPISADFNIITVLADPYDIRCWNADGLPKDPVSTENAILVTQARRWPLMIDPQNQANRWIRTMEAKNKLKTLKTSDSGFLRTLEDAIRNGIPLLLEDIGDTIEASLEPVLLKQYYFKGGRYLIKLGDNEIDYDRNFRFYMTTKLANPHYMPEVCIKVTIINFTVTMKGLEDQLLSDVVQIERPDLEKLRVQLIVRINSDKAALKTVEDNILRLLFISEGNILDNEELLTTLDESKKMSKEINARLTEAEQTEAMISEAREKYRPVPARGSVMYFVVATLSEIDPMYQYSLEYFNKLFNICIETSEKCEELSDRLKILLRETTLSVYTNVCRGLFERHKLMFSVMLCAGIMLHEKRISPMEWTFFLRGPPAVAIKRDKKPEDVLWLTDAMWSTAQELEAFLPVFKGLAADLTYGPINVSLINLKVFINPRRWDGYSTVKVTKYDPEDPDIRGFWNERLTDLQKIIIIKAYQEDKVVQAVTEFVVANLGKTYVENPAADLYTLTENTSKTTPLIFVLSPGSDPMGAFQRFAKDKGFLTTLQAISLGQGQGPFAERMINQAAKFGHWVFLQNCHVAASWMTNLENIVKRLIEFPDDVRDSFRLYISSLPESTFPVSVLQNSVKVTQEPPKGLRANIRKAFSEMNPTFFLAHPLGMQWRKIIFGLCFFHAIIQERKKFGPLGWNIKYEFNDSDRECCLMTTEIYCQAGFVRWAGLQYITSSITYGGRVTDSWDQRTLDTVLKVYFGPHTQEPDYKYSASGVYYPPDLLSLEAYQQFIEDLPIIDDTEVFGMHENANLAFQEYRTSLKPLWLSPTQLISSKLSLNLTTELLLPADLPVIQETQTLVSTVLSLQPRTTAGDVGKSSEDIAYEMSEGILEVLVDRLDADDIHPTLLRLDDEGRPRPLSVVLRQEIDRFNRLLDRVKGAVKNLKKAIKGFVVMNDQLEQIFNAFVANKVPAYFLKVSYPSLKSLGSWMKDLVLRIDFVYQWMIRGEPKSFWLSSFFFPQGMMTSVLQTYARKYFAPIDQLNFAFNVIPYVLLQADLGPHAEGAFKALAQRTVDLLPEPEDGVLIHGLFMDAGRFDMQKLKLANPFRGELNPPAPVMHMEPRMMYVPDPMDYLCPLYKTSVRQGTLSTTGHSTNFVVAIPLPSKLPQDYWITKGTAMLTQITD